MTRTDEELERAARHAMEFDPEKARPIEVRGLREISEATEAVRADEARQREAVALARAHGVSWNLIAGALGVTRQAARQRFSMTVVASPKLSTATRRTRKASTVRRAAGKAAATQAAAKAAKPMRRTPG
jgi:hypothetical protein